MPIPGWNRTSRLTFNPYNKIKMDCYVDAYFEGLWKNEDEQDPLHVNSRTGYVLTIVGYPLNWVSKLHKYIALLTLVANYIAFSHYMLVLLYLR